MQILALLNALFVVLSQNITTNSQFENTEFILVHNEVNTGVILSANFGYEWMFI